LLADLQSTIQQTNKLNSGVNGGYGSINGGVRSRLASAGSPVALAPEYATVRSHKIERSTSNPAVRQELSVCTLFMNLGLGYILQLIVVQLNF